MIASICGVWRSFGRSWRITGKWSVRDAAAGLDIDASTFSRKVSWCWNVRPRIVPDGVVHRYVEADGTYLPYGWCLLVASDEDGRPIAWQWCGRESKSAYRVLFARIVEPGALVTDGGSGCISAAAKHWKHARIQRCLVHVLRNTRTDLTGRPKSEAGRELLKLARRLTRIHDGQQAAVWLVDLNRWHDKHGAFIKERTRAKDDPLHARGRKWWWTHERVRRAYYRFIRLHRDRMLLTHLEPELSAQGPVAGTTNQLEGGVNAAIKRIMRHHRGLSEPHMKRACEWAVYLLAEHPRPRIVRHPRMLAGKQTTTPGSTGTDTGNPNLDPTASARHQRLGKRVRHPQRLGRTRMTRPQ